MLLKATEVFVPGSFPQHTYVERDGEALERSLRDALDTPGQIVSLTGPSKSGKTVLVERVVGRDYLIAITGASVKSPEDVWTFVLDWINAPATSSRSRGIAGKLGAETTGKGSTGIPLVAQGELSATGKLEVDLQRDSADSYVRRGLTQVVDEIGNSDFVVLVDDFHYMDRSVQQEVAKTLKEAVRLGVKIVTASVSHRGDDVVRANPELRGRVKAIDMKYWSPEELKKIADAGFAALHAHVDRSAIDLFVKESAGSPQLMQLLCLQACFVFDIREQRAVESRMDITQDTLVKIMQQTSSSTDFRSLVDVLDAGPRTRGTERKTYNFSDQSDGDVYRVVLRAIADDPASLSFSYNDLLQRTAKVCVGDSPVGSSVTGTCLHMTKLAQEKFPRERRNRLGRGQASSRDT